MTIVLLPWSDQGFSSNRTVSIYHRANGHRFLQRAMLHLINLWCLCLSNIYKHTVRWSHPAMLYWSRTCWDSGGTCVRTLPYTVKAMYKQTHESNGWWQKFRASESRSLSFSCHSRMRSIPSIPWKVQQRHFIVRPLAADAWPKLHADYWKNNRISLWVKPLTR